MDSATARQLVERYASFGEHRTGGDADEAVSQWIRTWLGERGIEARAEPFSFEALNARHAYASADGVRVEGIPVYDGVATGPQGIVGAAIVQDASDQALEAALAAESTSGAVVVTGDPEGHVLLRNAERMHAPWPKPALQVAKRDAPGLLAAAAAGVAVRLMIDGERRTSQASNVVAEIPAPGADGTVVLLTPKSGWFQCAAERGGGIAIVMALAARASTMRDRRRNLRVLFTSGHELGHRGLLAHFEQHPALRDSACFWLQLGASIGARDAAGMRVFTRDAALRDWFPAQLARQGIEGVALADADLRPHGESREVFERPFLSMAGRHPYFHSPQDVPRRTVDAASIARHGRAFAALLERLLR